MPTRFSVGNGSFTPLRSLEECTQAVARFVDICGRDAWFRRVGQLLGDMERSPFEARIASDNHWVELELAFQMQQALTSADHRRKPDLLGLAVMSFAHTTVALHSGLPPAGRRVLEGRLADGLNSGFASLFQELDLASMLMETGSEVAFPDFEGVGRHDLDVCSNGMTYAVECKSLSADAGRKVHRRDFYRFMARLGTPDSHGAPPRRIVLVTMDGRLPAESAQQSAIGALVRKAFEASPGTEFTGPACGVRREHTAGFEEALSALGGDVKASCRQVYGQNSHVAGPMSPEGFQLVVVRSRREDDPSKAALAARKSAGSQLPRDRLGIVAIQYEEIRNADLAQPGFRRRAAILDNYCYHKLELAHVGAYYHCAFRPHHDAGGRRVKPGFASWSPAWQAHAHRTAFHSDLPNSTFAGLVGADNWDPDDPAMDWADPGVKPDPPHQPQE